MIVNGNAMLKHYLEEVFEPSLLLGLLTAILGVAAASHYGNINIFFSALTIVGVVLSQIAINLINDYYDFKSGMDREQLNIHTKFSGGSKMVGSGKVSHLHALYIGLFAAAVAGAIGIYLALSVSLVLVPLIAVGAIAVFTYTKYFTKFPLLPEPLAMLGFALMAVGSFIVARGSTAGLGSALFALVPGGMLSGIQLLVNEVPDAEIDKKYGRKHAVIVLDDERKVAAYYVLLQLTTFALVSIGVLVYRLPVAMLAVLVTLPAVYSVAKGMLSYKNPQSFEKHMGTSVMAVLAYLLILIFAFSL
jgi:1,4-dihydroxy-2-naphthoate polyprenyltransferase